MESTKRTSHLLSDSSVQSFLRTTLFLFNKSICNMYKKTRETTVCVFATRLEELNLLSAEVPGKGDDAIFTDAELTRLLYKAMPKLFRDEFRKVGRKLSNETFGSLKECFLMLEELYQSKSTADNRTNKSNNTQGNDSANNNPHQHSNSHRNRNNSQSNSNRRTPNGRGQQRQQPHQPTQESRS